MDSAQSTLVIILASALALFLLLGIIALIKFIQILNHLKSISEKAEKIADSAEHVGEFFRNSAKSVSIAKLLSNIHETIFNKKNKKSDDE